MTFNHINRRTHLYLAMFLMPWFVIYAVSSIPFAHPDWGRSYYDDGVPQWTLRLEQSYDRPVPEDADLRAIGKAILFDLGIEGAFGVSRRGKRLNVYRFDFLSATRVTYDIPNGKIKVEDRRFRWDHLLTGMHARGGFRQDSLLNDLWGVVVDIVSLGFLVWIASGIYMWWLLPGTRRWGAVALAGGVVSFTAFMVLL